MSRLNFKVEATCPGTKARAGRLHTLHGEVQTPVFMPVGTQATVKSQTVESLKAVGSSVLLANTYHLMLRPGIEVFQRLGGIHRFMDWDGPVLTDSGGFQIFSLPDARSMREEGATFTSYVDGRTFMLSPETSIEMQRAIGSDIMMVLDQCIPSTAPYDQAEAAMQLTHRWAIRSLDARGDSPQSMFGIVQGACHEALRKQSAEFLAKLPFDGLAIGGLAVGETHEQRYAFTSLVTDFMPPDRPRYLMGVGTPLDLLEAVDAGVDMFDCIIPSQFAQRGVAFTATGKMHLRRAAYRFSEERLDPTCTCHTCQRHSRAYLHHLVKCDELLAWYLLGLHNLHFYHTLMRDMRAHIHAGTFPKFKVERRAAYAHGDGDPEERAKHARKAARKPRRGDYEIITAERGHSSIRQVSSGEVMHSVSDPKEEAHRLYVEQPQLAHRLLTEKDAISPLVYWDVGLGAASNAMAIVDAFEQSLSRNPVLRPLHLISFERDLDPLRLTLKHPALFPHVRHPAPHVLVAKGEWIHPSGLMTWTLHEGDYLDLAPKAPAPDIIAYDPFSFKTDTGLWTAEAFAKLREWCGDKPAELYTYSAATAVRVALLRAGFFVAAGKGTGPKKETTIGYTRREAASRHPAAPKLLDQTWLARWRRSAARYPESLPIEKRSAFDAEIEGHAQWLTPPSTAS